MGHFHVRFDLTRPSQTMAGTGHPGTSYLADIHIGFMRVYWGLWQGLLSVRQAELFLGALHRAASGDQDIPATGDFAVTSNEGHGRDVPPAEAGSVTRSNLPARLKSCPDTRPRKLD